MMTIFSADPMLLFIILVALVACIRLNKKEIDKWIHEHDDDWF